MRHFPIFLDTQGQTVAFAGAGNLAIPKIRLLLKSEARLVVFAANGGREVQQWAAAGLINWVRRPIELSDLEHIRLLYIACDDRVAAQHVRALADQAGVLASPVDSRTDSDFFTPALVDRDPVVVAIGTGGTAPILARRLKAQIENLLNPGLGVIAQVAGRLRPRAKPVPHGAPRRSLWGRYFDSAEALPTADLNEQSLEDAFDTALPATGSDSDERPAGRIALVGAGPGDPELLTVKARNRLFDADVVLHDRLVDPRILDLARREARFVETGKSAGKPGWSQDEINAAMIREVRAGHHVVRLKSGDPLVFGRADEELDALATAGIEAEIVPGITAAAAAACSIGHSLTRRARNSAVTFITGQDVQGFAEQEWRGLARPGAVFAIYMGVRAVRFIQGRLLIHGADAATPVSIVENASRSNERRLTGTLGALPELMEAGGIEGPAILFVGLAARRAVTHNLPSIAADDTVSTAAVA